MKAAAKNNITCIRCGKKTEGLLCSCGYWNIAPDTRLVNAVTTLDEVKDEKVNRLSCGRWGFCFGNDGSIFGPAVGTTTLIGGFPGAGKSTFFLHLANAIDCKTLYLATEEKLIRIKQRADRLGLSKEKQKNITCVRLSSGEVPEIGELAKKHSLLLLDSINMLVEDPISAVRFCSLLAGLCDKFGLTCILTSHVTKGGDIAGFEALQHVVDCTMSLFPEENIRTLVVEKNRNGMAFVSQKYLMGEKGLTILGEEAPGMNEEQSEND